MAKCCICGKEADINFHGLWWCENHSEYLSKKSKTSQDKEEDYTIGSKEKGPVSLKLKLEWV